MVELREVKIETTVCFEINRRVDRLAPEIELQAAARPTADVAVEPPKHTLGLESFAVIKGEVA